MNTARPPFDGTLPEGWSGGEAVTKHWRGEFIHLYRVQRPCKTCQTEISIDVTKKALQGFTKNAGLLLRNCPVCREARKAGGIGSRGGTSRPVAQEVVTSVDIVTDESLRSMVKVMTEELDGLYAENKDLRARLALYELQPALEAAQNKLPWE